MEQTSPTRWCWRASKCQFSAQKRGFGKGRFLEIGDVVWPVPDVSVPTTLRHICDEGRYIFVGQAYVNEIMPGETVKRENLVIREIKLQ